MQIENKTPTNGQGKRRQQKRAFSFICPHTRVDPYLLRGLDAHKNCMCSPPSRKRQRYAPEQAEKATHNAPQSVQFLAGTVSYISITKCSAMIDDRAPHDQAQRTGVYFRSLRIAAFLSATSIAPHARKKGSRECPSDRDVLVRTQTP